MGPLSPAQLASGELPLFAMTARTTKLTWLMDPLIVFSSLAKSPLQGAGGPSRSMDHQAVASHFASLLPSRQTFSLIWIFSYFSNMRLPPKGVGISPQRE